LKLQPTEPISEQLSEVGLLQIATKDELREKAGLPILETEELGGARLVADAINALSPLVANKVLESMSPNEIRALAALPPKAEGEALPEATGAALPIGEQQLTNGVLRSLSGREYQGMMRVVRQFSQGKLSKEQASLMMKNAYGLNDEECGIMLGIDDDPITEFSADLDKFEQVAMQFGVDADNYQVLRSKPVRFEADNSVMAEFMEVEPENKALDKKILAEIKRTKKVEADQISRRLDVPLEKVSERIEYLISKGQVTIENRIARIADTPDTAAEEAFEIRYKYDWRPEFKSNAASLEANSRDFCKTLLRLNKLYTRQDIDQMSSIMGYSVWDRRGEWYTLPGTNVSRPSCRHIWQQQIVVRKGNKIELV
jgi:hypothetical protein